MIGKENRLIFNGVDFSKFGVIEDVRTPFISITNNTGELPQDIGVKFRNSKLNGKIIEVDLRLIEESRKQVLENENEIKKVLITNEPKKLQTRDNLDTYYLAVLDGDISFEKFLTTGLITLKFLSPDGIKYANKLTSGFTNKGNIPNLSWKVLGKVTADKVKIVKKSTLEKIEIDTSTFIGKKIIILAKMELIKCNNVPIMQYLHYDSDFFKLDVGENDIEITGLDIDYITNRARWI